MVVVHLEYVHRKLPGRTSLESINQNFVPRPHNVEFSKGSLINDVDSKPTTIREWTYPREEWATWPYL